MNNLYVCMECGYEWEGKDAFYCPKCGCGDFAKETINTFNYDEISIKNIEDNPHLIFICDGNKKQVIIDKEEIWKPVKDYEGLYEVSDLGRVRSLDRIVIQDCKWGSECNHIYNGKILKPRYHNGYVNVRLNKNGKPKTRNIHRIVAEAFIPNPENKKTINHKDGNKSNNKVDNLEWATDSEQQLHAYKMGLKKGRKKKIIQYDIEGNFIKEWESIKEAQRKLKISNIYKCCNGSTKTCGGYVWKYKEENNE